MGVACDTPSQKSAIRSWFSPFCDDMEPESAEVLCDRDTDREKKLRAIMIDRDGGKRVATRTAGKRNTTVTIERLSEEQP